MAKLFVVLAVHAVLVYYVHALPAQSDPNVQVKKSNVAVSVTSSKSGDQALLPPLIREMEDFEGEINENLKAILPFLNFVMNTAESGVDDDDECLDEMVIQLVADDTDATNPNAESAS